MLRAMLVMMFLSGTAVAQVAQDRRELRQDRRDTRDGRRDLLQMEAILARFDAARAANDFVVMAQVDASLRATLYEERRESRVELARDQAEVRRGRREVRRDARRGRPLAYADDKHDL